MIGDTFDLFGENNGGRRNAILPRTLEVVEKENKEVSGQKIAEGRQKDVQTKLAVLKNDPCAAKIISYQSASLTAKRYGPNLIYNPIPLVYNSYQISSTPSV